MLLMPVAVFFAMLVYGIASNELSLRGGAVFLAIWFACRTVVRFFGWPPAVLIGCDVLLDAVLILMLFGGDIRLT